MKTVTIIGGGFSGLTLAHYLAKQGMKPVIYEGQRVGGLISTVDTQWGKVETAANGLLNSKLSEDLLNELGLDILPTGTQARARYVFHRTASRWPLSVSESLRMLPRALWNWSVRRQSTAPMPMETMLQWASRSFSPAFAKQLLAPALLGIYAGEAQDMSASLLVGPMFSPKSVRRAKPKQRGTVSVAQGMGHLIEALRTSVLRQGGEIVKQTVTLQEPCTQPTVIATSAAAAAQVTSDLYPELSAKLAQIEMLPIVTVTNFYQKNDGLKGFGVLFASDSSVQALGSLMNELIFPGRSSIHSETWIYGGSRNRKIHQLSDQEIKEQIQRDRKTAMGSEQLPVESVITRWPQALPYYNIQLEKILGQGFPLPRGVYLHGNYLGGLGLAKILDRSFKLSLKIREEAA